MHIKPGSVWIMHHEPAASHIPQDDKARVRVIDFLHADRVRVAAANGESYILYASCFIGDESDAELIPIVTSYFCVPAPTPTACATCNPTGDLREYMPICPVCEGNGWLHDTPVVALMAADYSILKTKLQLAFEANVRYSDADENGTGNAVALLAEFERLLTDALMFAGVIGNLAGKR